MLASLCGRCLGACGFDAYKSPLGQELKQAPAILLLLCCIILLVCLLLKACLLACLRRLFSSMRRTQPNGARAISASPPLLKYTSCPRRFGPFLVGYKTQRTISFLRLQSGYRVNVSSPQVHMAERGDHRMRLPTIGSAIHHNREKRGLDHAGSLSPPLFCSLSVETLGSRT